MIKATSVFLRHDVLNSDADYLIKWLTDDEVVKYLNESPRATEKIRDLIDGDNVTLGLTYHLNQGGIFFMLSRESSQNPCGFVRLIPDYSGKEVEMVIVIGDKRIWGQGYGTTAVHQSLKKAFFELRCERVVANIHTQNIRSIKVFKKSGFKVEKEASNSKKFSLEVREFLKNVI